MKDLPRDLLADLGALPSRENGVWLLGGAALPVTVYQLEDAAGAAPAVSARCAEVSPVTWSAGSGPAGINV